MAAPPIFDAARCGRRPVPSIYGAPLVADCTLPDPPAPILQAQNYLLTLAPPGAQPTLLQGRRGSSGSVGPPGDGTYLGQVVAGGGNRWVVKIYPGGPLEDSLGHSSLGFTHDVTVLNAPDNADVAPLGNWVAPLFRVPNPDGNDDFYYARPPGGKLALTPPGGIPAKLPGTPGIPQAARCIIYQFVPDEEPTSIGEADVYNSTSNVVGQLVQKLIQVKYIDGYPFVDVEDCG